MPGGRSGFVPGRRSAGGADTKRDAETMTRWEIFTLALIVALIWTILIVTVISMHKNGI